MAPWQIGTIFELVPDIIGTNLLKKVHESPKINVPSTVLTRQIFLTHNGRQTIDKRLFTCFHYIHKKTAQPPGGHVFPPIMTIFELVRDIYKLMFSKQNMMIRKTYVLTQFHEDWTTNVTSRLNTAPPPGGHVFQGAGTIFELNQHII
ncbi:hypothetical protein DPMN_118768 [Dreissena polymorpha]|uniref:Uncharacterized protein n=1 Tax=Dreissena polymorpha TaxID=45954 RepID=A0A9D4JM18_DREPO|nr:hypothetical protein DPMN_118768 [Dreissena polymorpha]